MTSKRILVIAGSDSSGGAGLEADQKVIAAHGCYAMTATTALTAQNTQGVYDIHQTPSSFVRKQIDACIEDIGVDVVKTGMLASASTIEVVAEALKRHNVPVCIVDPVMVSTSGAQLLPENAVEILIAQLLPVTTLLTPNLPEAQLILKGTGKSVGEPQSVDDIVAMAKAVRELGPKYVLLKGGHVPLTKDRVVPTGEADRQIVLNVLVGGAEDVIFETAYLKSKNTHGTGCSLASAIASRLASGMTIEQAVKTANYYIEAGIRTSQDLGKGSGPINHFHSTYSLPFAPGRFLEYVLDREDVKDPWREHTHHSFVHGLADGTLPLGKFKNYLIQDYLFLIQFSRANALAAYKAKNLADINKSARIVQHIQEEMGLHIKYCESFGLTKEQIESHKEHPGMGSPSLHRLFAQHSTDTESSMHCVHQVRSRHRTVRGLVWLADSAYAVLDRLWPHREKTVRRPEDQARGQHVLELGGAVCRTGLHRRGQGRAGHHRAKRGAAVAEQDRAAGADFYPRDEDGDGLLGHGFFVGWTVQRRDEGISAARTADRHNRCRERRRGSWRGSWRG